MSYQSGMGKMGKQTKLQLYFDEEAISVLFPRSFFGPSPTSRLRLLDTSSLFITSCLTVSSALAGNTGDRAQRSRGASNEHPTLQCESNLRYTQNIAAKCFSPINNQLQTQRERKDGSQLGGKFCFCSGFREREIIHFIRCAVSPIISSCRAISLNGSVLIFISSAAVKEETKKHVSGILWGIFKKRTDGSECGEKAHPHQSHEHLSDPRGTLGMSKMDAPSMQDVYILSPVSGLYGTREELGLMSCDEISRYSSQPPSKGSEAVSYYLDQESGQYFSLLEGEGPPGPDYDRGRNTGVRRRDKTPTHGDHRPVSMPPEYNWMAEPKEPSMGKRGSRDSDNSLLRYLSDDKILVIEEEPEGPGRESRRDSTRRSRRKSRNPSSPSFPLSPSLLSSTLRLDQPLDALSRGADTLRADTTDSRYSGSSGSGAASMRKSFHYTSLRTKTKKKKGSLTSASRRRISCKDLGHGDCEGWLWKKKDAKGYFTQKWRKYWFILKESCLYWYTNQNDEKAEGFISLPEFRIDRAIECRRKFAFKACHPKIKSFFFATDCLEEMNRWMNRLGLAAIGYTPDDPVPRPDEDYWSESDQEDVDGSMTLKQEVPSSMCDTYHRTPSVNSSSPFPEPKHGRHFSSESTHSHSSAEDQRGDGMGMGTGTGSTSTHSSGYRERRSWQDLIETPLTSAGLHFLQTAPGETDYSHMGTMAADMGIYGGLGRQGMSPERRRQATLPVRRHHAAERDRERDGPFPLERGPQGHSHSHRRSSHKQRSQSLPRNRDPVPGKLLHTSAAHVEERSEDEEGDSQADMLEAEEDLRELRVESRERRVSEGRERRVSDGRDPLESLDGLEQLYRALEQANVTALGDPRPSSRNDLRRCFTHRARDPLLNDRLHRVRALRSTLKAKESELAVICALLEEPGLCSQTFREWKQWHSDLFSDICQLSPGSNGQDDLSPLGAPLMTHTHSFIETHV
ncbi:hypothetical protein WMY93_020375 [Mugilogobius chulae]|uniref:PH domain-containing protein n=1 Tax=Mugilogobius chulae TaxID=88201 RepID=A0AAW0NSV6_9GOBI